MTGLALYRSWARPPELPVAPTHTPSAARRTTPPQEETPAVTSERKEQWYTFLVVGRDGTGGNTDTLLLVGYDVSRDSVHVMSIPRDLMVNVPWDIKRINSVYAAEGIEGLKQQVKKLVGFAPDYYINIDMNGFVELVDAVGGVEFDIPINMYYDDPTQNLHIRLKKGLQHLNGKDAMKAVRFRINNDGSGYVMGDAERMEVQQRFLLALAKQCLKIGNIMKIGEFARIFSENVETDLELGNLVWFAEQLLRLDAEDGLRFYTLPGDYSASAYSRTYRSMQSYVTPDGEAMIALINEAFNPYHAAIKAEDLDLMRVNADGSLSASAGEVADKKAK